MFLWEYVGCIGVVQEKSGKVCESILRVVGMSTHLDPFLLCGIQDNIRGLRQQDIGAWRN
jgi:hypothetical protein